MKGQPTLDRIADLLLQLRRKLHEQMRDQQFQHDLTGSQLETLWFIGSQTETSMESIAHHLGVKPPSVTAIIDKMEHEGYVVRTQSEQDRRVTFVSLSPRMKTQFATIVAYKKATFAAMFERLTETDRQELERLLSLLVDA